ncbi:MAG: FecR family protein [Flavobacteriaceae bacterium]|nr:FecR family protein [Flavobacteriaceae bacterium]
MKKEQLLHRYLNGTASPEEIKTLEADAEFMSYLKIATAAEGFDTPSFDKEHSYSALNSKLNRPQEEKSLRPRYLFMKIAAALIILIAGYLLVQDNNTTFTTEIAEKENFLLPDDSQVTLNAQSEISFNEEKWNESRTLSLKGEAFFKVKKGEKFSVETPQGVVEVLGTQFNVFSRGNRFDIKCYEGLVSVTYNDTTLQIPSGTRVEITDINSIHTSSIAAISPNWISNESAFENVSLSLVLEELKRQYPIKLTSQNMVNKKFTGSFTHNDLNVALRSICDPLQMNFTIKGDEVTLHAKKNN